MRSEHFKIATRDGRTHLHGQIDLPFTGDSAARYPAVVLVPGGWFMERDGYMGGSGAGGSGTERDLIYRDLAGDLLAAGIATLRYDNRGVHCNELTMPRCPEGADELAQTKHYLHACVDPDVRLTVSVQTQMDDVEEVWSFARKHPAVDPTRIVLWAHSEGGLNTARLIGAGRICPRGVIFVGVAAEDPAGLLRWQTVDRYARQVMEWDHDGDGRVTVGDIEREYPMDSLFARVGISRETLMPPDGGWTMTTIEAHFATQYEAMKNAALAAPDGAPYPSPEPAAPFRMVAASNNWWKQWFLDTVPMIDHLAGYPGPVTFHFEGLGHQEPGKRQLAIAEQRLNTGSFVRAPRLVLHKDRGHAMRTGEAAAGPLDPEFKRETLTEIQEMLKADGS